MTFNENGMAPSAFKDAENDVKESSFGIENEITEAEEAPIGTEHESGENPEDTRREYEHLIKTRFRALYAEDMQKTINKRFKRYKQLEERIKELETERNENKRGRIDDDTLEKMMRDSEEELSAFSKDYSFESAKENLLFRSLARIAFETGEIGIRDAYKLAYYDELVCAARKSAESETEARMMDAMKARHRRPTESATVRHSTPPSFDVSRLTRAERERLARRALSGERIKL